MSNNPSTLQSMKTLHRAFYLVLVFFAAGATYLVASHSAINTLGDFGNKMQVIVVVFTALVVFTSEKFFRKILMALKEKTDNKVKMDLFRQASILQWALLESAALFSIVGFFMTTNYSFLALAICIIVYIILLAPSVIKTTLLTGISAEELNDL